MATDFIIDADMRLVLILFSGRVTVAEMYDGRHRMMADPGFGRSFSQLVDARSVTTFEMKAYTIKEFAQEHVFSASARRAIVMKYTPDFGLARMFQIYRELAGDTGVIQIFDDMDKAIKWLGLPSDYRWNTAPSEVTSI